MFRNYIKIAWRNIIKYRFYAAVNIMGLLTGITFTLLVGGYVWQEIQVNKKLANNKSQYILTTFSTDPNVGYELATFGPIARQLKEQYPHLVANYYRWDGISSGVSRGNKQFRENLQVGDSTLLNMYGFELLHGDARTALKEPYSVVITSPKAVKYFGRTDVVGETITIQSFNGGKHDFKITGVLKELSENSVTHLARDYPSALFIPLNTLGFFGRQDIESWQNLFIASYIQLKKGVSPKDLENPIKQLVRQNADASLQKIVTVKPVLLTDYYLQKDRGLVIRMLYTLAFTGGLILLMAVINFINLTISRSSLRMREIGVRKVMGGVRKQLVAQFLTESVILVLIATIAALGGYALCKPVFAQIVGKELPDLASFPAYFILIPFAVVVIIGLAAGLYPAFVLSSMRSVDSLKNKLTTVAENIWLRKSLIGFQFSLAIVVLIAAFVVTQQVAYFFGKRLGYNKEYIVSAQVPRDWTQQGVAKMASIRDEFLSLSQVSAASLSYEIPDGANAGQAPVYKLGTDSASALFLQVLRTDEAYLNTYQIPLEAGTFFTSSSQDSGRVVINEKAVTVLGYKNGDAAIGQQLRIPGDPTLFTIKGVVTDFTFGSMQQAVPPILFFNVRFSPLYRYLSFKLKPGNMSGSLAALEKKWSEQMPGSSFEYKFMDETLKNLYKTEIQLKNASYTASVLSLVIVLLGVLGLVSFSIQKRTKEIGIRKVLGASLSSITVLFLKDFMGIIAVSCLIACPVAWVIMQYWLSDYAYRIVLTATPFAISIAALVFIAVLLISIQTIKAATANPVKNLRTE